MLAHPPAENQFDLDHSPFIVFYEATRACDLACAHCRACAVTQPHHNQLGTDAAKRLFDQLAQFPEPPMLVITGGDPLKRPDLLPLVRHARALNLTTSVAPAATPLASHQMLGYLKDAGVERLAVSIDGIDDETHDALRRVPGSFRMALDVIQRANHVGLPVQINTTINRNNVNQVRAMGAWLAKLPGVVLWSVFFLVPVGRARQTDRIAPHEYEMVFAQLLQCMRDTHLPIKTTEAPFYRRYLLQHHTQPQTGPRRGPLGINDGKGVMFISHTGQVFPSGFLPIECGRFPTHHIVNVYQKHPLFRSLRNPDQLGGKCGACEYRAICGGSRARAYALTRDPLAAEPDCAYIPQAWQPNTIAN